MAGLGQLGQQMYGADIGQLGQAGALRQSQAQNVLDAQRQTQMLAQQEPFQRLSFASGILTGTPASQMTVQQQPGTSPWMLMSVLNRKLFAPVRMHTGGVPPHAPEGHTHNLKHPDLSDQQVVEQMNAPQKLSGIMEGFGEATDEQGIIDPATLAEKIYPGKTTEEYEAEARSLYSTDLSTERAEVERQKQEDIVAGMIGFGARLATGRGNALDVL